MTLPIAWCLTAGIVGLPWTVVASWLWVNHTPARGASTWIGFAATILGAAAVVCGFVGADRVDLECGAVSPKNWTDDQIAELMTLEAMAYHDGQCRQRKLVSYREMMNCVLAVMRERGLIEDTP